MEISSAEIGSSRISSFGSVAMAGRSRCVGRCPRELMRIARCKNPGSARRLQQVPARVQERPLRVSHAPERFRHNIADHHPGIERCNGSGTPIPCCASSRRSGSPRSALTSTPPALIVPPSVPAAQDRAGCRALTTSALADQPTVSPCHRQIDADLPQWTVSRTVRSPSRRQFLKYFTSPCTSSEYPCCSKSSYVTRHRDSSVSSGPVPASSVPAPGSGRVRASGGGSGRRRGSRRKVCQSGGWPGMLAGVGCGRR